MKVMGQGSPFTMSCLYEGGAFHLICGDVLKIPILNISLYVGTARKKEKKYEEMKVMEHISRLSLASLLCLSTNKVI